jgi:hypothetical protein
MVYGMLTIEGVEHPSPFTLTNRRGRQGKQRRREIISKLL